MKFPQHLIPRQHYVMAILASVLLVAAPIANADGDGDAERENLARITNEIERLQIMVKEASTAAPAGQRVKFRYDWLTRDLQMMRDGIEQHVDAPRQPRPVPPLRGEYRN